MAGPTALDIQAMLDALLSNGLSFLEKAASEVEDEPKFSVVHFATGIELLLKARLFREHWSLVSAKPSSTPWTQLTDGTMMSIQASDLGAAITSVTGLPFKAESDILKQVFDHRNRVLHFVPAPNVADVVAEQFRAWFHMQRHLTETWASLFSDYRDRVDAIDATMRRHKSCLQVRFDELAKRNRFAAPKASGLLVVCPVCGFQSGVVSEADAVVTELKCAVCISEFQAASWGCGNWHSLSDGFYGDVRCPCGEKHAPQELAGMMDGQQPMSPKEQSIVGDTQYNCGECLQGRTVVLVEAGYRCFGCGIEFDEHAVDRCEWCNEGWAGYDCSDTAWNGCEFCEGRKVDLED